MSDEIKRTTGALSREAQEYIKQWSSTKPPQDIADYIGKSLKTVTKYQEKHGLNTYGLDQDEQHKLVLKKKLHNKIYWSELKSLFTDEEIKVFEDRWVNIYVQFDDDVLETEDLSIKKYIQIEILCTRCLERKKKLYEREDVLDTQFDRELTKTEDEGRSQALIDALVKSKKDVSDEIKIVHKEHNEYLKSQSDIEKSLKATRDARIDKIQDPTKNWSASLRLLQDPKIQRQVSKHIEIMRAAQLGEARKLMGYHTYLDGKVDNPLLSYETLEYLEKNDISEPDEETGVETNAEELKE